MLGVAQDGPTPIERTPWIEQLCSLELCTALVALIPTRIVGATVWAGALDIAIGEKAPGALGIELGVALTREISSLIEAEKDFLGHAMVVLGVRVGKHIVADTEGGLRLQKAAMIVFEQGAWRQTTPVGLDRERGAVRV